MKKSILKVGILSMILLSPNIVNAGMINGLNILVNSNDAQTQTMAMTLAMKSLSKHGKQVNIVLCSKAGDLADKNILARPIKKPNKQTLSAKGLLKVLIKKGASVKVCPLYLPNSNKNKSALLEGITVANPVNISRLLLDVKLKNISF